MPPKNVPNASTNYTKSNKRKDPPNSSSTSQGNPNNGRHKRAKIFEKRSISTQDADAALNNGELDLQKFLDARKFEINALENGMQEGKGALNLRAFQQVPRDMRRRTASHNVKRVPKRMRNQAKREMEQDNAPTVDPSKRKPRTSRGRVRAETANRLGILAGKKSATEAKDGDKAASKIDTRPAKPKIRKNMLNAAPRPKSKFRKRQIHKTWLPTHLWHAKRARMTEPKNPLWRFSIPITSTEKSYRPTHTSYRHERGCCLGHELYEYNWTRRSHQKPRKGAESYGSTTRTVGAERGHMEVRQAQLERVVEQRGQRPMSSNLPLNNCLVSYGWRNLKRCSFS